MLQAGMQYTFLVKDLKTKKTVNLNARCILSEYIGYGDVLHSLDYLQTLPPWLARYERETNEPQHERGQGPHYGLIVTQNVKSSREKRAYLGDFDIIFDVVKVEVM